VVTSGNHDRVQRELAHFGMVNMFEALVCHEHITQRKPHPEGLEIALRNMTVAPAQAAYVGDAPEDIQMGKEIGVLTVAVRSNYPCGGRLLSSAPDIYLERFRELDNHFPDVARPE
jgi:phosphoglycolate phosphatase-like HAD superfamily hydrolase